jgi:hypothetical protein
MSQSSLSWVVVIDLDPLSRSLALCPGQMLLFRRAGHPVRNISVR